MAMNAVAAAADVCGVLFGEKRVAEAGAAVYRCRDQELGHYDLVRAFCFGIGSQPLQRSASGARPAPRAREQKACIRARRFQDPAAAIRRERL